MIPGSENTNFGSILGAFYRACRISTNYYPPNPIDDPDAIEDGDENPLVREFAVIPWRFSTSFNCDYRP
jgi:hypothetical protein